jgi:hypothetical protein
MTTNLRIGQLYAYQPYTEVEPVSPYPRIDPQQSQEESAQEQNPQRQKRDDQTRRRYRAMRRLVEEIKSDVRSIQRVTYLTAEQELRELGLILIEQELPPLLETLKIPNADSASCFDYLQRHQGGAELQVGEALQAEFNPFPVFIPGLVEYDLCFPAFPFRSEVLLRKLQAESRGQFVLRKGRLALVFFTADQETSKLWCRLYAPVGVCEIDDEGRRAIFYQRSSSDNYALYADKQLDFAI